MEQVVSTQALLPHACFDMETFPPLPFYRLWGTGKRGNRLKQLWLLQGAGQGEQEEREGDMSVVRGEMCVCQGS